VTGNVIIHFYFMVRKGPCEVKEQDKDLIHGRGRGDLKEHSEDFQIFTMGIQGRVLKSHPPAFLL
jgi:hypothetical protein